MSQALIEAVAQQSETPPKFHTFSVTPATVIQNVDMTGSMRVQVQIAWLPGVDPWVWVAVPMAGPQRGTFFIPQTDDVVLVAFNHGDIRDSYVIGSLWQGDDPPASDPQDAINKRLIRSPKGLEIRLDDEKPEMVLTLKPPSQVKVGPVSGDASAAAQGQQDGGDDKKDVVPIVTIDKKKITIKRSSGKDQKDDDQIITMDDKGITFEVKKGDLIFKVKKGKVSIDAKTVETKSSSSTKVEASGNCTIKGQQIKLN